MISLYFKIPEEFVRLIIPDGFWVVLISLVKVQFLAQLPVDHLAHPVMSSLIRFLYQFAAFAYYVIARFVSITSYISYFVTSYLFLLCSDWSLWRCSMSLLEEIQFLF